jgi:hypothetical protein
MRLCLVAAFAALAVASSASAAQRNRVPEPDVAARVAAPLVREAGGYAVYQEDVSDLESAPFASLEDIDGALEMISTHNPDALARAWIAYAALVAAQSPEFVDGVRQTADYYGRDAVVAGLRNDPSYAGQVSGAEFARQSVLSTVAGDASRLREISGTVKEQAYSLQTMGWAAARSGDNDERIAWLEAVSLQPRGASDAVLTSLAAPGAVGSDRMGAASAEVRANFWRAFRLGPGTAHAAGPSTPTPISLQANPRYQTVLDQVVTLAAFEALDAANANDSAAIAPLLNEPATRTCMTMARLHFQQCVAASHFRYEDPFCIAEHGVKDVGDCFSKVVGQ